MIPGLEIEERNKKTARQRFWGFVIEKTQGLVCTGASIIFSRVLV